MIFLRYNTASQEVSIGPFVDSGDGDTEESGLSIANTDIKLHKAGASTLASKNSGGATYISNGVYYMTLDATDTNTVGSLVIYVHVAGALACKVDAVVLPAVVYDALIAGTDNLQVDTVQVGGTSQTANDMSGDIDTILSRIIGTLAAGTHNPQGGDAYTRLGAPAGASIAADLATIDGVVDAILVDTDELQTDDIPGLIAALNDPTPAAIADAVWDEVASGHVAAGSLGKLLADLLEDTGTTIPGILGTPAGADLAADIAAIPTAAEIDTQLTGVHGAGSWAGFPQGAGAIEWVINVAVGGSPEDGVEVWISTDAAGATIVAGPHTTDALGNVTFYLDAGSYYAWCQKSGVNFTNPQSITVS